MRKTILIAAVAFCSIAASALADVVAMPADTAQAAPAPAKLPQKGENMAVVVKLFGEPKLKHKAAGDRAPKHPPITRWDYDGFSVFFEHGTVIDAVVPSRPAEIHHAEELKTAK